MVRIFVSPSHLCTLYMILYARSTRQAGHKDILLLDWPAKKKSLIDLLKGTQRIYNWHSIIDLSTQLDESEQFTVSTKKSLTRKLKEKPGLKQVYDLLYRRHIKKQTRQHARRIAEQVAGLGEVTEINMLTGTGVNNALLGLFPKAQVNYFEHGIGDYHYIPDIEPKGFKFHCIFADEFKKFLASKGSDSSYVTPLEGAENFPAIAKEVMDTDPAREEIIQKTKVNGKAILILLEAAQIYEVPDQYYIDYIDLCMKHVENPQEYTFILKPHPRQTPRSMDDQKKRLEEHYKVKTLLLHDDLLVNYSAEVLFSLWKEQVHAVFSVFTSAVFYNSVLYANDAIRFYYSYEFFTRYQDNAPPQFKTLYRELKDLLTKVLSYRCITMS